jgi:HK97 family phage major capsid protein
MSKGEPPTLAGYPVMETEFFGPPIAGSPTYATQNGWSTTGYTPQTGDPFLMFGDFSKYWIADGPAMRVLRLNELFATTRQVGYLMTKFTDGVPTIGEAFCTLVK